MRLISILGDSISTYEGCQPPNYSVFYNRFRQQRNGLTDVSDTWWFQVIRFLGGELCVNNSYSGSTVSGGHFPSASSQERLSCLHLGHRKPDMILVYIGFNDFGTGVRIHPEYLHQSDPYSFEDSYRTMLTAMQQSYPAATIVCGTLLQTTFRGRQHWVFPQEYAGVGFEEYNDVIRALTAEKNCLLADLAATRLRYETLDGTHPTANGHQTIAQAWNTCLSQIGYSPSSRKTGGLSPH